MATSRRTGNYSTSAKAVIRASDQIFDAAMSGKPDFTKISKEAIKGRSLERRAVTKAEGDVATAGIRAASQVKGYRMKADALIEEGKRKGGKARMAGALGALGSLAGGFVIKSGQDRQDARDAARDAESKAWQEEMLSVMSRPTPKPEELPAPPVMETPDLETPGGGSSSTPTSGESSGASSVTDLSSQKLAGSYDLSKLTPENWSTLSRAVSGEAGPGDDRYAVVGSILNRVSSDKFPGTIKDVVYQNDGKGTYQYEAFTKGTDFNDPKLTADLSSPEGQKKILKALGVLDGRTDFKGTTMYRHRSNKGNKDYDGDGIPDMDPKFHPRGNFYHYSHQT